MRCERVVGAAFAVAAGLALLVALAPVPAIAVPMIFGLMGVASGLAGPSRDVLVKRSTPPNATGRVYGVVYSGLDAGLAIAPPIFGAAMDAQHPLWLFTMMAVFFVAALVAAMSVGVKSHPRSEQVAPAGH